MRWEEMSWDKVRRAQMRWSVECEECSVKCEVWSVKCEVWSVKCEVWTVKCEVWSVECAVGSAQCEVWSVECGVWSVECEAWSAKWSFKCDMWSRTPLSQSARTHGLGWRTARASSIDEKGLIHISLRQLPPRLARALLVPLVITGLSRVSSLITGVIIHLLTGMNHQVPSGKPTVYGKSPLKNR